MERLVEIVCVVVLLWIWSAYYQRGFAKNNNTANNSRNRRDSRRPRKAAHQETENTSEQLQG